MMNAIRTTFLLAAMTGLFLAVGFVVGGTSGMLIALVISVGINLFGYWNSDKMVLRLQRAHRLSPRQAPDLFEMVEGLSRRAGIPMPALYLIDVEQPNAFATGRNPENAAVAVSSGLIRALERRELAGVIAHELAHIRSRDTLVMTLTATLAGAISMLAQFGLFFGGRSSNNPLGAIGGLLAIIVAPIAALLVQMAVSRTREYEADRDGAEISGDPLALASALKKISQLAKNFENPWARRAQGMAHMFIVNPLAGRGADSLFATHPNVDNRVAELVKLAEEMGQASGQVRGSEQRNQARRPVRRTVQTGNNAGAAWRIPSTRSEPEHRRGPWG